MDSGRALQEVCPLGLYLSAGAFAVIFTLVTIPVRRIKRMPLIEICQENRSEFVYGSKIPHKRTFTLNHTIIGLSNKTSGFSKDKLMVFQDGRLKYRMRESNRLSWALTRFLPICVLFPCCMFYIFLPQYDFLWILLLLLSIVITSGFIARQYTIFEDRMEIHNPGGIYGRMKMDQLGKVQPDTRNPVLAVALENLGITENWYSGIPTMRREFHRFGLKPPEFLDQRGRFIVRFYNQVQEKEDIGKRTEGEGNSLLVFCRTPRTRKEISEYLGLSSVTYAIQTHVMPLVESGLIHLSIPDKPQSPKQLFYSGKI